MGKSDGSWPVKKWYDWLFILTVGLFSAAILFVVLDRILSVRLGRVIAALLASGSVGVVAMSMAEDFDMEWRCGREERKDA